MQMTWRWYGEGNDQISLSDIKQIPGVEGIVWALHDKMPGEVWQPEEIAAVKNQLDEYGFNMDVVESVNVHDDIKIGLPTRDQLIENYKQTIRNLAPFGVKVICYNFMPVFDWTRTDLFHPVGGRFHCPVLRGQQDPRGSQGDGGLRHVFHGKVPYDLPRLGAGADGKAGRAI